MFKILSTCKGGGYMYARTEPLHPKANSKGLYPLHRVLAENRLGRLLEPGEVVHHRDHNKSNNDPENLEVQKIADHSREHQQSYWVDRVCTGCGRSFRIKAHVLRLRLGRNAAATVACSRTCGGRLSHRVRRKNELAST